MEIIVPKPETKKIDIVLSNWHESDTWLESSSYKTEWSDWNSMYRSIPKKKPYGWMSNKFYPMTMSKVEAFVTSVQGVIFSSNPPFDVLPREFGDTEQAKILKKLLGYQFEEAGVFFEFLQFLRSLAIYGTAIGKVFWDVKYDYRTLWTPQPVVNNLGFPIGVQNQPDTQMFLSFNGPKFINCNIDDIRVDPCSLEIQDSWVIHRTSRTRAYLESMHENYPDVYNEEVLKLTDEDGDDENKARSEVQDAVSRLSNPAVTRPTGGANIKIKEWWGDDVDPQDGKIKPRLYRVAADKYLITETNNPYWHGKKPFVKSVYIPTINEFYGMGIPEIVEDLQNNLNEIVNQRNDNISFALNRPVFYNKNAGIKAANMVLKPGGLYGLDVEDIGKSVVFPEIPNYTRDAFAQVMDVERWAQEVTAITKLTVGLQGKDQNDTATGMAILQRASSERFIAIAKQIENTSFKEIIKFFYQLDYQYIDTEQVIRIVGPKGQMFQKVTPDDVRRDYDIVPAGIFSMENKGQKALRLIQWYNITKDDPATKKTELLKKIHAALEIGDDPEEVLRSDAEVQEIVQIAMGLATRMHEQMMKDEEQSKLKEPSDGEKKSKLNQTPGMAARNPSQMTGAEIPGRPGVPPIGPAVAPMDRV